MRYTAEVNDSAKPGNSVKLRYLFAGLLCTLLLVFAVSAKVASYHPEQQAARLMAATKVSQNNAIPVPPRPILYPQFFLALISLLVSMEFVTRWQLAHRQPARPSPRWFSPVRSVRPPPAN